MTRKKGKKEEDRLLTFTASSRLWGFEDLCMPFLFLTPFQESKQKHFVSLALNLVQNVDPSQVDASILQMMNKLNERLGIGRRAKLILWSVSPRNITIALHSSCTTTKNGKKLCLRKMAKVLSCMCLSSTNF